MTRDGSIWSHRFFDTREFEVSSREFHTIGGTYKGKSVMCLSHGIGTDNIDIVVNELDALANIDFSTRYEKPQFRQLTLVRVGTSGGLQPHVPIGTPVIAEKSIGSMVCLIFMPVGIGSVTLILKELFVSL